jgi:hypothetical protein
MSQLRVTAIQRVGRTKRRRAPAPSAEAIKSHEISIFVAKKIARGTPWRDAPLRPGLGKLKPLVDHLCAAYAFA